MFKKLSARLGIIELVWLEDFKGRVCLQRKRSDGFNTYAYAKGFDIGYTILHEDGTTGGDAIYIERWKDYEGNLKSKIDAVAEADKIINLEA